MWVVTYYDLPWQTKEDGIVQIRDDSIGFRLNIIDNLSNDRSTLRDYSVELMKSLRENTDQNGIDWFLDLLRVSSCIPEIIKADSSEEKRYSKYTDTLLTEYCV